MVQLPSVAVCNICQICQWLIDWLDVLHLIMHASGYVRWPGGLFVPPPPEAQHRRWQTIWKSQTQMCHFKYRMGTYHWHSGGSCHNYDFYVMYMHMYSSYHTCCIFSGIKDCRHNLHIPQSCHNIVSLVWRQERMSVKDTHYVPISQICIGISRDWSKLCLLIHNLYLA